jgi:protein-disulfide isomerase
LITPQSHLYNQPSFDEDEDRALSRFIKTFAILAAMFWTTAGLTAALAAPLNVDDQLKDVVKGDPNAPNTIIEYYSLTCGHCAKFHVNVLPKLKKNLIDTGKAKFIARDFPTSQLGVLAHMMARCAPSNRYYPYVDTMFSNWNHWTNSKDPVGALKQIAKLGGMSQEKFEACLKNEKLYKGIQKAQDQAQKKFGVDSTPTIIVNGKKVDGTYEAIEKALKK